MCGRMQEWGAVHVRVSVVSVCICVSLSDNFCHSLSVGPWVDGSSPSGGKACSSVDQKG